MPRFNVRGITMETAANATFADDEQLTSVCAQWSASELLEQSALFFLKDICPLLGLTTPAVVAQAKALRAKGQDPYTTMGVRKLWNHWYVRMKIFAPYYQVHFRSPIRTIPRGTDANTLLAQQGLFLLSQVCKCIPFSSHQLRYQARTLPAEECGIFKQRETYLVQMEVFGPWLSRLWREGFASSPQAKELKASSGKSTKSPAP